MSLTTEEKILNIAEFIESNAEYSLSLDDLAKQFAISSFHLQRTFKHVFGVTPKQFHNAIRMQRVKQSLKQGEEIFDAIFSAGYGSTSRVYEQIDEKLGMTLSDYKAGAKDIEINFALAKISLGCLCMAATDRGVCFVHLADNFASLLEALHHEFPNAKLCPTDEEMHDELDHWITALEQHLEHNKPKPNVPLHLFGTAFQLSVWKFLVTTHKGDTISYKHLAQEINKPNAVRAVANACAANNIAILVPCHRVLRANGNAGGYRWGFQRKEQILKLEQQNQA